MNRLKPEKQNSKLWQRLLLCIMPLLPLLVINLGYSALARIELHWQEREQIEVAQQELEALTQNSSFAYQMSRKAGNFADRLEIAFRQNMQGSDLASKIENASLSSFSELFSDCELHVFKKTRATKVADCFLAKATRPKVKGQCL